LINQFIQKYILVISWIKSGLLGGLDAAKALSNAPAVNKHNILIHNNDKVKEWYA